MFEIYNITKAEKRKMAEVKLKKLKGVLSWKSWF